MRKIQSRTQINQYNLIDNYQELERYIKEDLIRGIVNEIDKQELLTYSNKIVNEENETIEFKTECYVITKEEMEAINEVFSNFKSISKMMSEFERERVARLYNIIIIDKNENK